MSKEIKLHTIATFQGKEYELEELLNELLKEINEKDKRIDKAIEYIKEHSVFLDVESLQEELIEILKGKE